MKILFFGDVYGKPGREAVRRTLPDWRKQYQPDFVVANAENAAHGAGVTAANLDELRAAGVDAFTLGDHFFDRDFQPLLSYPIIRPANLVGTHAGVGANVFETPLHQRVLLINLLGKAFLGPEVRNYFNVADELLRQYDDNSIDAVVVDFHAEATSETIVLGSHLDGRVSALVGTHTHVPTADTRLLPKGTAFQSDVGMCGSQHSAIGATFRSAEAFLRRELGEKGQKGSAEPSDEEPLICDAVLIDVANRHGAKAMNRLTTRSPS